MLLGCPPQFPQNSLLSSSSLSTRLPRLTISGVWEVWGGNGPVIQSIHPEGWGLGWEWPHKTQSPVPRDGGFVVGMVLSSRTSIPRDGDLR